MRTIRTIPILAALSFLTGTAAAVTPHEETAALEFPLAFEAYQERAARRPLEAFRQAFPGPRAVGPAAEWQVRRDPQSGWVSMAHVNAMSLVASVRDEVQAEAVARAFLLERTELVGVRPDNIHAATVRHASGRWSVRFQQAWQGVPVWKGTAFVLLDDAGRLAAFGSDFHEEPDGNVSQPALSANVALATAAASIGATAREERPRTTELYWVPVPADELFELAPAWRTVFESEEPFGKWETFVHAATGEILSRRNLYFPVDVVGTTEGSTAANPPSYGWCDGFSTYPYEHMNVNVSGGSSDLSDASGDFVIPHTGTAPVLVLSSFVGAYSNVDRFTGLGADASQSVSATPGTPFTITWNNANSRPDERTTFYHANRVHDFMTTLDPTFTELDYAMPSVVGRTDGFCPGNAWWDGFAMNYCESGVSGPTTYYNTGELGNVIYHEFGHGVTQEVYARNGQPEPPGGLHEGNSDVIANFLDRNPHIGLGFSTDTGCGSGIRNAENTLTYPSSNETGGHSAGQVIAGFHWLAWQSMLAELPASEADAIAFSTWHFGRDLGTPQTFPEQVEWTFMADDDDANLTNGTPNCEHLCLAAEEKGFDCPPCGIIITHAPPGHTLDGSLGFDVEVTIVSAASALNSSALKTFYRLNGGPFTQLNLTPTGSPDEYHSLLPAVPSGTEIEYYFRAEDIEGNVRTSPFTAPAELHNVDVPNSFDALEGGIAGWTVGLGSDDALSGWWDIMDPVGTAAQPEDDATPSGTLAFITGQCAPGEGSCTTCQLGCNDVDGGVTTLVSPVYNLAGSTQAKIKYSRWYSNDTGATPGTDFWVVDVSNNGGASWTNVENTNASAAEWISRSVDIDALFGTPGQVKLRFIASDLGAGSLVEAGVDDIRIFTSSPPVDAPSVAIAALPTRLELEPSQPNPFRSQTRIEFALPERSDVHLAVYDVSGRVVRLLAEGLREPGRHPIAWDARDAAGSRVAAGVYFFRLTAGEGALTRKVTVMQ